jgi:hypothetical protein
MTRNDWFVCLSLLISLAIVRGYLWIRGIRPSKRSGLREHLHWEVFPKDEQTKYYLKQRLVAAIVVLPTTLLLLNFLFEGSSSVLYKAFEPHWWQRK